MTRSWSKIRPRSRTWTRKMDVGVLEDYLYMRYRWKNSTATFRGGPVSPLMSMTATSSPPGEWPEDYKMAFLLDNPDYIVWSGEVPILWHSTVRKGGESWVQAGGYGEAPHDSVLCRVLPRLLVRESQDSDTE